MTANGARHFLSVTDYAPDELRELLSLARRLKQQPQQRLLAGRSIALIFEKPSLRTRLSFDVAAAQLGGHAVYLNQDQIGIDDREPLEDIVRVLSRMVDGVVLRTFQHSKLERMAAAGSIPVINALSDREHPCQAVADLMTVEEQFGRLEALNLAYIGDGNNVASSLALACASAGINFSIACPEGYDVPGDIWQEAETLASRTGARLEVRRDPIEAAAGSHVLYTDVWTSMGQEDERDRRATAFAGYQIDRRLVDAADDDVIVMHDLPAHHDEEITTDVFEAFAHVIFNQAENRLHLQKAILVDLLADKTLVVDMPAAGSR